MISSMKRLYFLVSLVSLALFAGCMVDDIDYTTPAPGSEDAITVIGRITRFDDCDVTTRGVKNEAEAKLTSMAMAIFKVNATGDGLDGNCVYWQYTTNQAELLFTIDRGSNYTYNARYAMYVFTNMDMSGFGVGSTLDDMLAKFHSVADINIPANGFPMMGSLGDTFSTSFDRDNQEFILSPTKDGNLIAPTVDGTTQTLLTIPMKAMYAKVNFTIQVSPDQTIEGNYSPQFTFEGCTINNVPSTVDFSNATNSDSAVLTDSFSVAVLGNTVASGANKINFSFYLPERLLSPTNNTSTNPYDYTQHGFEKRNDWGSQIDANGNGYRDEDEDYFQRFKSFLLSDSQKATNIVLSGRFRDHQNHYWNVDYTIFLGANNTNDFNIVRNAEYNNYVTIRGIQSSDDMSDNGNAISIDHRVNITRSQPAIISLRREVLLDSHFEVRPLRIRKSDVENVGDINAVKVEVVNPTTTNWMRLERSFGDGTPEGSPETKVNGVTTSIYIDEDSNSPSYGKRKFFTYNLIDGVNANATDATLKNSTEVILPLTDATECCWIYVDECTEVGDEVRAGIVKVSYGKLDGTTFTPTTDAAYPAVSYVINQRKLFEVKYDDPSTTTDENRKYHIEYEEEYLHNFDADDNYGQTEYEGMQWGLPGIQLSYEKDAIMTSKGSWGDVDEMIFEALLKLSPKYDFYLSRDVDQSKWTWTQDHTYANLVNNYNGYNFCDEIIELLSGEDEDMSILTLSEKPDSAIEYCYNKNKRDASGKVVMNTNEGWYLPAIDEIEEIVTSKYGNNLNTYARFLDFQNKFYWSSQPGFINNFVFVDRNYLGAGDRYGQYMIDDTSRARATSVFYSFTDGYNAVSSGSTGYTKWINAYMEYDKFLGMEVVGTGKLKNFNEISVNGGERVKGSNQADSWDITLTKSEPEGGNLPRTSYARIRCVRKMQ